MPTSTGAAISVTEVVTDLKGKFDGIAMRVPSAIGSIADITMVMNKNVTVEDINSALEKASKDDRWKGVMAYSTEELVSMDIKGERYGAIVDSKMTRVVDGDMVKVMSWYDNEMGYTNTLVEHVIRLGKHIK